MSTCTIIIKIKDYFPKVDTIPYQNFICLFTCGENEGQLPLLSQEKDYFQHEITNVISDIKYKVHVLDFNDMSLIGMCEMTIPYKIINQIKPPNGFIQEQQKKILIDVNTKRKLFGTVLNMGDIYINIYSELYLSEKNNKLLVEKTGKSTARKKKVISNKYKKLDGSPKTVKKKKLIMKMNSDRQAIMNFNKNNINSCVIKNNNNLNPRNDKINNIIKQNNSFNYKEIQLNRNGVLKSNNHNNISFRERLTKQKSKDRMNEEKKSKDRNINYKKDNHTNILNRIIKTETNKNYKNEIKKLNKKDKDKDNKKIINKKNVYLNNQNENENLTFNNHEGNKITTIESLDDIDISEKQYITKSKTKNDNQNNTVSIISNTLFTTNSIEQELNEIENNIIEKNKQIKNDFGAQLKDNKNNNKKPSENGIDNNINQLEIKNNLIKLIDYYALLNHKLLIVHKKNIYINKKCNIYREKLSNELKKNNILIEKKKGLNNNIINENNNSSLNEKFIRQIIKLKKSEFKIYQNIFNLFYYDYDILKWKEEAKNKKMEEGLKIDLLLVVFKNLIKNYGNISQIYLDNMQKKNILKKCFHKFNLNEKEENNDNKIIIDNTYNKKENKDINNNKNNVNKEEKEKEKSNKNEIEKFRVINEVDEEKEDEIDDEEDKLSKNQNYYNNDDISCPSSNIKENSNFYNSNKKLKSDKKNKSGQKNQLNNENLIKYNNIITNVIKDENKIEMNINKNNLFKDENKDLNNNNINDDKNENENENQYDEINKEELKNEKKNGCYENSE